MSESPVVLPDVVCPECNKAFRLEWRDYAETSENVEISWCLSGGVYMVVIRCPHCGHGEEI